MVSSSRWAFLLGACLLILAVLLVFLGVGGGGVRLVVGAVVALFLAAGSVVLGAWLARRGREPLERRREQRLWRSGPLGRHWLRSRKRLP